MLDINKIINEAIEETIEEETVIEKETLEEVSDQTKKNIGIGAAVGGGVAVGGGLATGKIQSGAKGAAGYVKGKFADYRRQRATKKIEEPGDPIDSKKVEIDEPSMDSVDPTIPSAIAAGIGAKMIIEQIRKISR